MWGERVAEPGWIRHSMRIGVVEFRRSVRVLRNAPARLLFLCIAPVVWSLILIVLSVLFAGALRSVSGPIPIPAFVQGTIGMFWLFDVFLIGQRVISQRSRIDSEEIILTAVSARTAASGLVIAEVLRIISYVAVPTIIITGLSVYAFHSPVSVVMIPLAVGLFVVSSVVVAHACGFVGAFLLARSPFIARHKTPIGGFLILVVFGGYSGFIYAPMLDIGLDSSALAWLPVSWYIDLAAIGTPLAQSWAKVTGVLTTTAVSLLGGGWVIERVTSGFWFDAPVVPDGEDDETERATTNATSSTTSPTTPLASALHPFRLPSRLNAPSRRVAQVIVLRTWRNPSRLSFALVPVLISGSVLINSSQFGYASTVAPVIAAIAVPWTAGLLFGLNPLGDTGAVLPATLTTQLSGRQFIHGLMVPGRLIGLPATILLTIAAGVVSPYTRFEQLGLLALGLVLLFTSVQLAPLVGLWFPRFSAISVGQRRDVVPPSVTAVVVHALVTLGLAVTAAASLLAPAGVRTTLRLFSGGLTFLLTRVAADAVAPVAAWFQSLGAAIGSIPTVWIRIVGFGGPMVIALAVADRSLRYAARRFDAYTIE